MTQQRDPGLDTPRTLHLERGTVLYFGRKARKAVPRIQQASAITAKEETHVPVILPKSAKNASRIHCSARIVDTESNGRFVTEVRVTGQNGMKVDGKVWRNGSVVRVDKQAGETMRLSFWGWSAKLVIADSEVGLVSEAESEDIYAREEGQEDGLIVVDSNESHQRPSKSRRRVASPALSFRSDDHGLSPEPEPVSMAPSSSRASSLAPAGPSPAAVRAAALASSLGLDLPGLIASAIVFHARSTVAASEVIHGLLAETRSMWTILTANEDELERVRDSPAGEARAIEAWQDLVEDVLAREDMFGMIDNSGLKVRVLFCSGSRDSLASRPDWQNDRYRTRPVARCHRTTSTFRTKTRRRSESLRSNRSSSEFAARGPRSRRDTSGPSRASSVTGDHTPLNLRLT